MNKIQLKIWNFFKICTGIYCIWKINLIYLEYMNKSSQTFVIVDLLLFHPPKYNDVTRVTSACPTRCSLGRAVTLPSPRQILVRVIPQLCRVYLCVKHMPYLPDLSQRVWLMPESTECVVCPTLGALPSRIHQLILLTFRYRRLWGQELPIFLDLSSLFPRLWLVPYFL